MHKTNRHTQRHTDTHRHTHSLDERHRIKQVLLRESIKQSLLDCHVLFSSFAEKGGLRNEATVMTMLKELDDFIQRAARQDLHHMGKGNVGVGRKGGVGGGGDVGECKAGMHERIGGGTRQGH